MKDFTKLITVLSGMSNIEQMEDNLSYMKDFTKLSEDEEVTIKEAQEVLKSIPLIPCKHVIIVQKYVQ